MRRENATVCLTVISLLWGITLLGDLAGSSKETGTSKNIVLLAHNGESALVIVTTSKDENAAADKPATVRWSMLTTATPELANDHIILTQGGKKLTLKVNCSTPFVPKTWSTEPTTDYDAPNPGTVLVGFELQLAPHQKQAVDVALIPGSSGDCQIDFSSLAQVMAGIPHTE